jgi:hypothetical protein
MNTSTSQNAKRKYAAKDWRDILVLSPTKKHQATIRRYYIQWRDEQGIPLRCDNRSCQFYTAPLDWNGIALPLILDHLEGNRYDNDPGSLRLLCPNCDAQLTTRGGANRGRVVEIVQGGYTLRNRDGSRIVARSAVAHGSSTVSGVGESIKRESGNT